MTRTSISGKYFFILRSFVAERGSIQPFTS